MRMFHHGAESYKNLFHQVPQEFNRHGGREVLQYALGATLYMPALRENLLEDIKKMARRGISSLVICLEDSIPDDKLLEAESNLTKLLHQLAQENVDELPLLFCRVRSPEHYHHIIRENGNNLSSLTGMVFPKFDALDGRGAEFLRLHEEFARALPTPFYYMPVIESPSVVHRETRKIALKNISELLGKHHERLLAVRIGATDMGSVYALRRNRDFTIYDVHVIASALADIVNVLGRAEDDRVITGPVWEHFNPKSRTFKTQLRESIFDGDVELRNQLLTAGYDNFIKEVQMDKLNGIIGKTIIHPSHILIVNSLLVVSHEEYQDALEILNNGSASGAQASSYRNKMNEVKPHLAWARQIESRAHIFGVAKENVDFIDFLERGRL